MCFITLKGGMKRWQLVCRGRGVPPSHVASRLEGQKSIYLSITIWL